MNHNWDQSYFDRNFRKNLPLLDSRNASGIFLTRNLSPLDIVSNKTFYYYII